MPKWNIFFMLSGPYGKSEAPNKFNPVESEIIHTVLQGLIEKLPKDLQSGLKIIGLRIEEVEE